MSTFLRDVCFTPESGHWRRLFSLRLLSERAHFANHEPAQSSVLRRCASGDLGILRRDPRLLARTNEAMENHSAALSASIDFRVV
jgi:hypothetical protein